jgi:hypothetical protein
VIRVLSIVLILLSFSCASIDTVLSTRGKLHTEISEFDDSRIVYVTPALTNTGAGIAEFGLYWDSKKGDIAHLIVQLDGAVNFAPEAELSIKIDGKLINLKPVSRKDYGEVSIDPISNNTITRKSYFIHKDDILLIANGEKGAYRIMLLNNKYIEGKITYKYQNMTSFIPDPFRRFYKEVWRNN